MESINKLKDWIKENAPMFSAVYENKYVGMAYDRFGSLPPTQQKQVILGSFFGIIGLIFLFLLWSYISLWSSQANATAARESIHELQEYQAKMRDKGDQMSKLEQNAALGTPGQLKTFLVDTARAATITPKSVEVEEKSDSGEGAMKSRDATVVVQRINLSQLRNFMQGIEFGPYNITVTSLKITNDEKLRGFMRLDLAVSAVVPQGDPLASGAGGN